MSTNVYNSKQEEIFVDKKLNESDFSYSSSPIRFSIGAILYHRSLWEDMNYFKVDITKGMAVDETQICEYCMSKSKAIVIAENTCVGHLSFGLQNNVMEEFFKENQDRFLIKD